MLTLKYTVILFSSSGTY